MGTNCILVLGKLKEGNRTKVFWQEKMGGDNAEEGKGLIIQGSVRAGSLEFILCPV